MLSFTEIFVVILEMQHPESGHSNPDPRSQENQ